VGCIPKKLMHQAALLGQALADAPSYGWEVQGPPPRHSWETLVTAVQAHIKSLNFGYRSVLLSADVEYVNGYAAFDDARTLSATMADGSVRRLRAAHFVIATGGRPRYLDAVPGGRDLVVSSDDLFSLRAAPGKTLCVGGGYVALECAGVLAGLGMEAHVLVRSRPLRGFDRQMSELVVSHMEDEHAIRFIRGALPTRIERVGGAGGRLRVTWKLARGAAEPPSSSEGAVAAAAADEEEEEEESEEYDTVLVAIGRDAQTAGLRLERAGVAVSASSGKIVALDGGEQTSVAHIHAIGDVLEGKPELTPVAIRAGRLLARRLCAGGVERMDYGGVPTAVFTPLEYACVGLGEDEARAALGDERVEVYHSHFKPLEWALPHRPDNACYAKLVCDRARGERVVGVHVCGPGAGEIVQGFALALKVGCTRHDFERTVAIHPTCAEELVSLTVTKRSGADARKRGC
jgi:thioredoxin reductase (NADPH)